MLKILALSTKLLWREIKHGEWFIVLFALLFSIAAVSSLQFYVSKLKYGIEQQSAKFLGGDLAITSPMPFAQSWHIAAKNMGLRTAEVWSFPSVVSAKGKLQLVNIQAVSRAYPLLDDVNSRPLFHTAWVDGRLLKDFIHINDTIKIGYAYFRVARALTQDINVLNTGWAIAPYVLIPLEDVPATQTVLPGSRVEYRLLLAGSKLNIEKFRAWVSTQLQSNQRLVTVRNQRIVLFNVLETTEQFLQLILLISLAMSGVAIALSIQQFLRKHYKQVALWRCLGIKKKQIRQIFFIQLALLALIAGSVGILIGYATQFVFVELFSEFLHFPLSSSGIEPIGLGLFLSIFLLYAFAYPLITQLPKVSPLVLWREEGTVTLRAHDNYFIAAILILTLALYVSMGFSLLTLFFIHMLSVCIGVLFAINLAVIELLRKVIQYTTGPIHRGLSQIIQHPNISGLQLTGFTLILILLLIISLIKNNMIEHWQHSFSVNTPNYFAFNIAPTDLAMLQHMIKENKVVAGPFYPMVRGRIIELNDKPILSVIPPSAVDHNALHRELNLSWMWHFPADNQVVSGNSWSLQDKGKPLISIERNLANNLGLKKGDKLTFQMGDKRVSAFIVNFRDVQWTSFHPNFYVIFVPGALQGFSETYITSFYLSKNNTFINQLVQQMPNITIIDVAALLNQVQYLISKISEAIQFLFIFILGSSILLFITSIQANMDDRKRTFHLLRILGASKSYVIKSAVVEFCCLSLLIAISAISLGSLFYILLIRYFFSF